MTYLKTVGGLLMAAVLVACGGGGGSAGTPGGAVTPGGAGTSGGTDTAAAVSKPPNLAMSLVDASNASTTSVSASGYTLLKVTLTDPSGKPIPNQLIDVTADQTKVIFPEGGTGLTNASGVATIKLARASLVATGAGAVTATYSYKAGALLNYPDGSSPPTVDTVVSKYLGYELSAANLSLSNLNVGAGPLAAYGTRQVSVQANINGAAATTTPVQVSFSATCGQVSPATATTNSNGVAIVSYSATDPVGATATTLGCGGKTVEIVASTVGANAVTQSLTIAGAPATNMSFVSASPAMIFLKDSGGVSQSIVQFKLVNARNEPLLSQDVTLTLKTLNGGIPKASFAEVGNVQSQVLTTDANGLVSIPVFSGTVPTNVIVNAALVSNPLVQSDSAVLTIASGRPAQARVSLAVKELAIEGFNTDGVETDVTMSLADRQGNPVPDGTAVNFVTEGGVMIPPVCTTVGSRCSVKIRSGNPRPSDGRVSVLAYSAGEEDFVDANYNNVYDCGETFTDLGTAYRDDNENGVFDKGEFSVPRTASPSACGVGGNPLPMTGDGVWGAADVRMRATVIFASSQAVIGGGISGGTLNVTIADRNGNSMPTGSKVEVSGAPTGPVGGRVDCVVQTNGTFDIPNSLAPATAPVTFACDPGDTLTVKVTTPGNFVTTRNFIVP